MDNFHLVQKNQLLLKVFRLLDCDYSNYKQVVSEYQQMLEGHYLLHAYAPLLTDLLKAKIYEQYLKTF